MRFCVAILSRILSEPVDSKALIVSVNSSGEEEIEDSWKTIFEFKPSTIYYGHARTLIIDDPEGDFLSSEYVAGKKKVNYDELGEMTRNPENAGNSSRLGRVQKSRVFHMISGFFNITNSCKNRVRLFRYT